MFFRRCVKFLPSECSGCYRQKVIDLSYPPALPKHVLLYRARGVEELDREGMDSESDTSAEDEEDKLGQADEDDEDKLDQAMASHGDF